MAYHIAIGALAALVTRIWRLPETMNAPVKAIRRNVDTIFVVRGI